MSKYDSPYTEIVISAILSLGLKGLKVSRDTEELSYVMSASKDGFELESIVNLKDIHMIKVETDEETGELVAFNLYGTKGRCYKLGVLRCLHCGESAKLQQKTLDKKIEKENQEKKKQLLKRQEQSKRDKAKNDKKKEEEYFADIIKQELDQRIKEEEIEIKSWKS